MWALALTVIALAVSGGVAMALPHKVDAFGRWFAFGLCAFFGVLFAIVVPAMITRPYRMRRVDGDRGVFRFAAENPAYTRLVAEASR